MRFIWYTLHVGQMSTGKRSMPTKDDGTRRTSQARSRTRSSRAGGSSSRASSRSGSRTSSGSSTRSGRKAPSKGGRSSGASGSSYPWEGLLDKLPVQIPPIAVPIAAAVIVLFILFAFIVPSCAGSNGASSSSAAVESSSSEAPAEPGLVATVGTAQANAQAAVETANQIGALETTSTKVQALVKLLGEEETAKLIAQAKTNPEALWIAAHPDAYAFDGIETQYKLLKLAADEPLAVSFVRGFPAKYPMAEASSDKTLALDEKAPSSSVPETDFPHLYQWDRRWGYTTLGPTAFGLTGAGPTALAMVYQGVFVADDITPYDIGLQAQEGGYVYEDGETANEMFGAIAPSLGFNCTEMDPDGSTMVSEVSSGHPIIVNLGPGTFTASDHFIVLTDVTDDGRLVVNDPNSAVRSAQTWDPDLVASEAYTMFVFTRS